MVVGEGEDAFAGVGGGGSEVVDAVGAASGHLAFGVEPAVAEPVVARRVAVGGGDGFGGGSISRCGCGAVRRVVRAVLVVMLAELVELALQLGDAEGRCSGRSVLPGVWGCPGDRFF